MKRYLVVSIAILSVVVTAVQSPSVSSAIFDDSGEIARLEDAWNQAHVRGDADALDRLWADELVVTVAGMPLMNKADSIAIWRSGKMKFQKYETSDVRINVFDNAAVVTGRVQRSRLINGRIAEDDWRFTKMYIRRAGRWQVVAWHASAFAQ
ncbi:MAG TPA: nuclear transport factor 2 family protein [Blastocatellia bacterium]|nr:nuclear transport factor 2 family protein [Blastocatellia bacterium]